MRKLIYAAIAAVLLTAGLNVFDPLHGDLLFEHSNKTIRNWRVVEAQHLVERDCAHGLGLIAPASAHVLSGGGPCGGATTYTFAGPNTGKIGSSETYTVQPVGSLSASVTVTPADASHGVAFTPTSVILSGAGAQTFAYEPLQTGTYNLSTTNSGSLSNPAAISFTSPATVGVGYPGLASGFSTNSATLTSGLSSDPFGGANAASCVEDATNNFHYCISSPYTVVSGQAYHVSAFAKQGSGTRNINLSFGVFDLSSGCQQVYNLSTQAVTGHDYGGPTSTNVSITHPSVLGANWWLLQFDCSIPVGVTSAVSALILDNGTGFPTAYTGDGTSGIIVSRPAVQ